MGHLETAGLELDCNGLRSDVWVRCRGRTRGRSGLCARAGAHAPAKPMSPSKYAARTLDRRIFTHCSISRQAHGCVGSLYESSQRVQSVPLGEEKDEAMESSLPLDSSRPRRSCVTARVSGSAWISSPSNRLSVRLRAGAGAGSGPRSRATPSTSCGWNRSGCLRLGSWRS